MIRLIIQAVRKKRQSNDANDPSIPISTYKFKLELAVVLTYCAINLSSAIFEKEVIFQTCTSIYSFNKSVCKELKYNEVDNNSEIKTIIDSYTSNIFLTESLLQTIIPALLALFIGPWSDKYGRKPVIIASFIGYCGFFVLKAIIAALSTSMHVNPWIYIIASVPVALSGGTCLMMSAIYSYVTDLTDFFERPYRMTIIGSMMHLGTQLGQIASLYLYAAAGPIVVFAVSAVIEILAILFVVAFIQESLGQEYLSSSSKLRGLLECKLLKDMFNTIFKSRLNFERSIIWFIAIALALNAFVTDGTESIFYIFVRASFLWSASDCTIFRAVTFFIKYSGAVIAITIMNGKFRLPLTLMALIGFGCFIINAAFYSGAMEVWCIYAGVAFSILFGIAVPMGRVVLSNSVSSRDIGKVFALSSALETLLPLGSSPLYTAIYNASVDKYPPAFNLLSCGIDVAVFILIAFIYQVEFYYPSINIEKL